MDNDGLLQGEPLYDETPFDLAMAAETREQIGFQNPLYENGNDLMKSFQSPASGRSSAVSAGSAYEYQDTALTQKQQADLRASALKRAPLATTGSSTSTFTEGTAPLVRS